MQDDTLEPAPFGAQLPSQSPRDVKEGSEEEDDSRFVCNVCLDNVRDPVVTLCGHLYWYACPYNLSWWRN